MRAWLRLLRKRLSLAQQFMLASLAILVASMLILGWWVGREIEAGVVNRTAVATALYAESFIDPLIQELRDGESLTPEHTASLSQLLGDTSFARQIVAFKVWGKGGRVLFATGPTPAGTVFPEKPELVRAWQGDVVANVSDLEDDENAADRQKYSRLLEFYLPLRLEGSDQVVAVAEFYQTVDGLEKEISAARLGSWLVVGLITLATYLLLAGIVRRGSDTIARQQAELREKVSQLTGLLAQNDELHERVQRAATRATELNERYLRRISAELHDGPAQDLSLALLRLDGARTELDRCPGNCPQRHGGDQGEDLDTVFSAVTHALQDVRAISTGLRLPELDGLGPGEVVSRVVRTHERRTKTTVELNLEGLPEKVPMPIKITLFRLIQEALSNAYRHGGGVGQQVRVASDGVRVSIQVSDQGPGFEWSRVPAGGSHLGLVGMRERVESLGGGFRVDTAPGKGTSIDATLPFRQADDDGL